MNTWRMKRAYKHRTFPPLNDHEKLERATAIPFISLKRAIFNVGYQIGEMLCECFKQIGDGNFEELRPYFKREEE